MVSTPSTGTQAPGLLVHDERSARIECDQQQGLPPQSWGARHSNPGTGGVEPQLARNHRQAPRARHFRQGIDSPW